MVVQRFFIKFNFSVVMQNDDDRLKSAEKELRGASIQPQDAGKVHDTSVDVICGQVHQESITK